MEVVITSRVVARLGGDEFIVLLGDVRLGDAEHVGSKLVATLSAPYPGVVPAVSCSVGIAMHPQDGHTVAELCLHADQALSEANRTGKGRISASSGPTSGQGGCAARR